MRAPDTTLTHPRLGRLADAASGECVGLVCTATPEPRMAGAASGRGLLPRPAGLRPASGTPVQPIAPDVLARMREAMNRAVIARSTNRPVVVLYALARQGGCPDGDLAACQGYAAAHGLVVADRFVDTVDDHGAADDPSLRRGYARALQQLSGPASNVTGLVSVSRTAISPVDLLYRGQLTRIAVLDGGLWLVRRETDF